MAKLTKGNKADLICIVILLLLSPAIWSMARGPAFVFPDSIAYITMGAHLLQDGLFYLPSWGHVDVGLILPPLYPLFIALFKLFTGGDALVAARLLSSLAMIAASILGFYYLRNMSHRAVALCAVLLIQLNYHYLSLALTPLSEPLFIAFTCAALLLGQRMLNRTDHWQAAALLLGLASALAYLSRQIGIVLPVFFIVFFLIHGLAKHRDRRQVVALRCLLILSGFLLLVVPHTILVKVQAGHLPTNQRYRMGSYLVTPPDAGTRRMLQEGLAYDKTDYDSVYHWRRARMKLLPDASEMHSHVILAQVASTTDTGVAPTTARTVPKKGLPDLPGPGQASGRLWANIKLLTGIIGAPMALLFLVTAVLSLLGRNRPRSLSSRAILPLFIISYLVVLSLLTEVTRERYLLVVFPLVILQVFTELYAFIGMLGEKPGIKGLREGILAVILAGGLVATPQLYHEVPSRPWLSEDSAPLAEFREITTPGDPVMSVVPQFAYYIGGSYRFLPNDTLPQTVAYARKTGARWLLVAMDPASLDEAALLTDAGWYQRSRPDQKHPELLRFAARSEDGYGYLYEIRPEASKLQGE